MRFHALPSERNGRDIRESNELREIASIVDEAQGSAVGRLGLGVRWGA